MVEAVMVDVLIVVAITVVGVEAVAFAEGAFVCSRH
jgi:hypothetical protein